MGSLENSVLFYNQSFTQDANATTTLELSYDGRIEFAGYIVVEVKATANTTFAQAIYSFNEINFDYNQTVGESGTAVFPVLPGDLQVKIGNTMQTEANNATVKVSYHY
jgi:hypothetical protein